MTTRVVIVDDHLLMREVVRELVESHQGLHVIAAVRTARDAEPFLAQADLVLLDLAMPGGGALELTRRLRTEGRVRTILVTMHENPAYVRSAIAAGAHGYVFKSSAERDLIAAIEQVMAGKTYFDRSISLDRRGPRFAAVPPGADLSEREREVLLALARGRTYKGIAKELRIGERTVETYRRRIAAKLGLHTRADFLRYAVELGWLAKNDVEAR